MRVFTSLTFKMPIEVLAALPCWGRRFNPCEVIYPTLANIEGLPPFCGVRVPVHYYLYPNEAERVKKAGGYSKVIAAGVRRAYPAEFAKWVKWFAPFTKKRRRVVPHLYVQSLCKLAENFNTV